MTDDFVLSTLGPQDAAAQPASDLLRQALVFAAAEDWVSAYHVLQQATQDSTDRRCAHYMLWEVCQALGHRDVALAHLNAVLETSPVTSRFSANPDRRVLVLAVPGDFQANLPLGALLSTDGTQLHTLWLSNPQAIINDPSSAFGKDRPQFDCVFIAIAEDTRHLAALQAADCLAASLGVPVINRAARIAAVSRVGVAERLRDLPHAIVPTPVLLDRSALTCGDDLPFPIIVRPVGAHAGQGLARLETQVELLAYLERAAEGHFFVAPFIDYRSSDGFWRKYRIIFVDGRPLPYHLAIHSDWAVWYYNARMDLDAWKRAEEASFVADIETAFPESAMVALRCLADRIGLDYFGLDCSVMPDGRLLVFEVETGMLVHSWDPPALYPYKQACADAIRDATEAMIDRLIAESKRPVT